MSDSSSAPSASAESVFSRGGLMLADGTFFEGTGFGAPGSAIGEVCFNTAMTGYQEILERFVLCRADRGLHLPPYRHCRHQWRGS